MTDYDDNHMDDFDDFEDFDVEIDEPISQKGGKRGFVIVLGGIAAVVLIVLIGVMVFSLNLLPGQQNQQRYDETLEAGMGTSPADAQTVEVAMQNVQTAQPSQTPAVTETIRLEAMTDEEVLQLSAEPKSMTTVTVNHFATATTQAQQTIDAGDGAKAVSTQDLTATIAVVQTQSASGSKDVSGVLTVEEAMTSTAISAATATALPKTGFADEVGLPVMLGAAALLLVVIFVTRRLRMA